MKSFLLRIRSYARNHAAYFAVCAPFDHPDYWNLVRAERWTATLPLTLPLAAVVHLIHLDRRTLQLQAVLGQETPNLAEHAPRGFVSDACFPLNLLCGDSAASRTHEVHRVEPSLEGSSGLLKHGASERLDVITAGLAGIRCAASHAMVFLLGTALLAEGYAIRPALLFDVLKAGVVVRKLGVKIRDGVSQFLGDTLFGLHARPHYVSLAEALLVVKG